MEHEKPEIKFALEEDMDKLIMMAACGLDCGSCEIRLAATDPAAAKVVVDWFRKEGWLKEDEGIEQAIKGSMLCGSSANAMSYCTI